MNNKLVTPAPLTDSLVSFAQREGHGCIKENVQRMMISWTKRDLYAQANSPEQNAVFEKAIPQLEQLAQLDKQIEDAFEALRAALDIEKEF